MAATRIPSPATDPTSLARLEGSRRLRTHTTAYFWSRRKATWPTTASQTIALYNNNVGFVAIYHPTPLMGTDTIGLQSGDANHYLLISQTSQFFLWGFEGAPSAMTGKGQRVFINMLTSLVH